MWPFIISLTGLFWGILLALLVPEEVEPGKKYFRWMQGILLLLLFFAGIFLVEGGYQYTFPLLFFLTLVLLFLLVKTKNEWFSLGTYLLFIIPYLQHEVSDFRLILSSLLFLYGLPTGTILWSALWTNKKKKT